MIVSSKADFRRDVFVRTRSDDIALERTAPISSKFEAIVTWGIIIASGCAATRIAMFVYEIAIARGYLQ